MKQLLLTCILLVLSFQISAQRLPSVSILGDSYSTFENYMQPDTNAVWYLAKPQKRTDVVSVNQTWWHKLIKENNYKLCINNSFSGTTVCNTGYRKENYSDRSFITRMTQLGCPDIIFIFGATNDAWAGSPMGEYKYSEWTRAELFSFRPAMASLLSNMIDRYPNVKLYFILNNGLTDAINQSVKTICEHYKVDCIELKEIDKINSHPSIKGMAQICEQVKAYLIKQERH